MGGKVQKSSALRAGQPGRDVDDAAPMGRAACSSVTVPGQHTGSPHQVVGHRRAQHPGGVRPEPARAKVGQWPVDEVGEHGLDDRVLAMGDVGFGGGQIGVGENG